MHTHTKYFRQLLLYFKHIYCQTNTDNGSDTSYKLRGLLL